MKPLSLVLLAVFLTACDRKATPPPAMPVVSPQVASPAVAPPATPVAPGRVAAAGLTFAVPEGWKSMPPANQMRLAELHLPDSSGDGSRSCIAVFSTAGGDIQANIDRWAGQVRDASGQPSTPVITKRTVSGLTVHIAEMTGNFSPGMGDTRVYEGWTLRGAIIESPRALVFIKMTGPAEPMAAAAPAFTAMIDSLAN